MRKEIYADSNKVAIKAAEDAIETLSRAIHEKGNTSWVLAGGSSPMAAYKYIAETYADALDWSKVTIVVGDERCVPISHEDSNWGQISPILFENERIAKATQLVPQADLGPKQGAELYSQQIRNSLGNEGDELVFDLLWLGVGEDGHTLSLFPGNTALTDDSDIVIPVYNSPKPPAERISLSLDSAKKARTIVIFATGASKKEALAQVEDEPRSLPVGLLAEEASMAGAEVAWFYDEAAKK